MKISKLTAKRTVTIWILLLRIHFVWLSPMHKDKTADWMAPKKDMMAVLEYWQGYFLPIFDWSRNHEDHNNVPATKATQPTLHLSFPLVYLMFMPSSSTACVPVWVRACWLNRGNPLYSVNVMAPPTHTNVPSTFALPLVDFIFTVSNLPYRKKMKM